MSIRQQQPPPPQLLALWRLAGQPSAPGKSTRRPGGPTVDPGGTGPMGGLGFSQAVILAPLNCLQIVVLEGLSALVLLGGHFGRCWRDFQRVLEGWTGPPSSSSEKINCALATNFPLGFAVEPHPAPARAGLCFGFPPQFLRQPFDERRGGTPTTT